MSPQKAIAVTAPQTAELISIDDPPELRENEIRARTLYTLVSPGTELAARYTLEEIESPRLFGYAAVAQVEQKGAAVQSLDIGDLFFCSGGHKSFQQLPAENAIPVPEGLAAEKAVIARLMGVTFTTLITTAARPGEKVIISGLGPVGFLGSQIFKRSGYQVYGCDPDAQRLEYARKAGIQHVFPRMPFDDAEIAKQATLVVECSGHEQGALDACNMVKVRGEVVLVGVPWQRKTDLYSHDLLHAVFHNYVVLRSGWEWEIPPSETFRFQHHTLRKNFETSLRWIAEGSIYLDGLCAMVDPRDCQEAYQNALHHKTEGLFTIFDWGRCS